MSMMDDLRVLHTAGGGSELSMKENVKTDSMHLRTVTNDYQGTMRVWSRTKRGDAAVKGKGEKIVKAKSKNSFSKVELPRSCCGNQ